MKINFKSRQITVSPAVFQHFERKLKRVERILGSDIDANITLSRGKGQDKVEITIIGDGGLEIRAEDSHGDLYSALDLVLERLERQIEKYKTRQDAKRHKRGSIRRTPELLPDMLPPEDSYMESDEDEPRLVRTKSFKLQAMDAEEACLQMELLGHSFFIFLSADTGLVNVVYRRRDGNYGLIEPE